MNLLFLCLKIFFVRILDVSLGTVRMIVTVKGNKIIASIIGFIEVLIWFLIVKEALNTDETSIFIALSYSAGYATGTFIGGIISDKVISGTLSVQVVLSRADESIITKIREEGYAVSVVNAKGAYENTEKYMLFIEINKNKINNLKTLIKSLDQKAFVVVNETKMVENGFFK